MPKTNRGPAVLAAGAAVQLLTGIPAAWGVFQRPVMEQYAFTRGQSMLAFAVLVAAYGVGCAVGGLLQDRHGPRFAALWGTGLLAAGFGAAALVPAGNAPLFLVVYSLPAGLGSAFLAPAVLACAQKWYAGRKGWATGVTGVAMGLSGAFFTLWVRGVGGAWGMRPCFAALGVLMLLVCGPGAAVLRDPPATS
ncbi:MAG: MFS transporter, partial [Gemmiger sp.]